MVDVGSVRVKSIVNASAERTWDALADFGNIHRFNPYLAGSHVDAGEACGVGTARVCDLKRGGSLHERVLEWRPGDSYTVAVEMPGMPVTGMRTKMAVRSIGDGRCEASMETSYQPKFGPAGHLLDALVLRHLIRHMLGGVLAGLGRYLTAEQASSLRVGAR